MLESKIAAPAADVHIVPCSGIDIGPGEVVLTTGLIISARLDAKRLEESLSLVVERKFPRAGARLVFRNGVYEFHIPHTFDAKTPAVGFTAQECAEPYSSPSRPPIEHLWSQTAPSEPWICDLPALEPYLRSPTCPKSKEAFLVPNTPLVHVHAAIFADCTFLGITSTHIMFDALGTRALLHGWTRFLAGARLDDIPGMPWDAEPFAEFVAPNVHVGVRGMFNLGLFAKLLFIWNFVLRLLFDLKEQSKVARVPKRFLEQKKRGIMDELVEEGSTEWVGTSDVLLAWWLKTSYSHRTDSTPLHVQLPINLRDVPIFKGQSSVITTPYINNAWYFISLPPLPANSFRTMSMRELALSIRRTIIAYNANLEGIAADVRWRCSHPLVTLFPCPPQGEPTIQSNWRAAKFAELDFSGAISREPGSGEKERTARVLFVTSAMSSGANIPQRGVGMVLMEDDSAIWMSQVRGAKDWEAVKKGGEVQFI